MLIEDAAPDGENDLIPDLEKIRQAGRHFLACIEEFAGFTPSELGDEGSRASSPASGAMVREVMNDIPPLDQERLCHPAGEPACC